MKTLPPQPVRLLYMWCTVSSTIPRPGPTSHQGIVFHLLSTQASSNIWIFLRMHKVVIIMTWVQHNNTTMNTSTSCLAHWNIFQVIITEHMRTLVRGSKLKIYWNSVCTHLTCLGMMIIPTGFWPSRSSFSSHEDSVRFPTLEIRGRLLGTFRATRARVTTHELEQWV